MAFNLIDERWIPVRRKSGKIESIAPAEIADRADPPMRIASPRPDFDGALLEFIVGLLQTACAPSSEPEWEGLFAVPPSVAALEEKLGSVRRAFFLDGDGPRFMQDLTVAAEKDAKQVPIGGLLIDRVGESELHESPTLFAKPGRFEALGYPAAAAALMAMQTYAPSGGRGQLTSLRGGGPLTSLVVGDDLWSSAWLNVLPKPVFEQRVPGDPTKHEPGAIFPWMAPTRTSSTRGGVATPPQEVNPLQHLWGLPRRFRLVLEEGEAGTCAVYGVEHASVARAFLSRPDGTSYDGDYRHPWTSYSAPLKPGDPFNPKKGKSEGLPYRDWPQFVTGTETRFPAAVISHFSSSRRRELVPQPRVLVFGYAMSNMKPLRWCQAETPLVTVSPMLADEFAGEIEHLIGASEEVRKTLAYQVKAAWKDRPQDIDAYGQVNPSFSSRTEPAFFAAVHAMKQSLERNDALARTAAKERWLAELHFAALELFDTFVGNAAGLASSDLGRAVVARRELEKFTRPSAIALRKELGLPFDEDPKSKAGSKRGKAKKGKKP